jgi:hypothetical protein
VSYDLAVWEGDRPADDAEAGDTFERLYDTYVANGPRVEPSEAIRAYVAALTERWIDLTDDDEGDVSPWSTGPLISEASGPLIYFPMSFSRSREVSAGAAQLAADHGLVCYDPQEQRLRPHADTPPPAPPLPDGAVPMRLERTITLPAGDGDIDWDALGIKAPQRRPEPG